jgi:hypothetical protein
MKKIVIGKTDAAALEAAARACGEIVEAWRRENPAGPVPDIVLRLRVPGIGGDARTWTAEAADSDIRGYGPTAQEALDDLALRSDADCLRARALAVREEARVRAATMEAEAARLEALGAEGGPG